MAIDPLPPPRNERGIMAEACLLVGIYGLAIAIGIRALVSLW